MAINDFVPVVGDRVTYFHDDDLDPGAGTRFKNTWTSAKVISVTDANNVGLEVGGQSVNGGLDVTRWDRVLPRVGWIP